MSQHINGEDSVKFWKGMSSLIVRSELSSQVSDFQTLGKLMEVIKAMREVMHPFDPHLCCGTNFTHLIIGTLENKKLGF